jgi:hypothetical protein
LHSQNHLISNRRIWKDLEPICLYNRNSDQKVEVCHFSTFRRSQFWWEKQMASAILRDSDLNCAQISCRAFSNFASEKSILIRNLQWLHTLKAYHRSGILTRQVGKYHLRQLLYSRTWIRNFLVTLKLFLNNAKCSL